MTIEVDTTIYPLDAIQRTAHAFTARCVVFIRRIDSTRVDVELTSQDAGDDAQAIAGEFANALLDQTLRARIAAETATIRELIVAQAFCEADLLDRRDAHAPFDSDPRGIARR